MTIRVLGVLGVIASMFAAACSQGAPGDVDSGRDGTATIQADQAQESTDDAPESTDDAPESIDDAQESTDHALASIDDAPESTGEVQQGQEVLNKYMLCYRIAFTTTKFACQYKHHMPVEYCTLLAEGTARTLCKPLIGVTG
jgi:hypothetical protein